MAEIIKPLLNATGVCFAYAERPVLRDVRLALAAGEVVALIGPNGSGKSTLIRALLGHLPASGEVTWDGRPMPAWRRRDLARFVAYLPQAPAFDAQQRVADVLRMGRAPYWGAFGIESPQDIEVVRRVIDELHLGEWTTRRMDEISGGQRQLVYVARALIQEPRALLLDEPNTYLDLRHQVELGQLMRRLARERSLGLLVASHDLNLAAAFADRLMLLHEGTVAADGSPEVVLDPELLTRVYGVRMERVDRPSKPPVLVPDAGSQ
ncbi:MAG TPA: ABC transporter ATP-binding protein [Tepidisphaeraceae bacterium]|nr:ABC transporter ATP-binding protein [Tepidisphaeraceae bacterium]